jgi:hypothetical protein
MVAALEAQAIELDRAIRQELARLGTAMELEAAQGLAAAIDRYSTAFVEYRAAVWLKNVKDVGQRGEQFARPEDEVDVSLNCPYPLLDSLPEGWAPTSLRYVAKMDKFTLARLVDARRREIMELETAGLYPDAGGAISPKTATATAD